MRERAAGLYRLSAYVLAVMTTELICVLRVSGVFAVVVYWMANLMPAAVNFVGHWLVLILMTLAVESFGMLISVVLPSHALVFAFNQCFMFFAMVTGGLWRRFLMPFSVYSFVVNRCQSATEQCAQQEPPHHHH